MSVLRMEWRVTDPDLPQGVLKAEALEELRELFAAHRFKRTGPLTWDMQFGKYPKLIAHVPVVIR